MPGRAGRWDGSLTRRPARRPSGVAVWGFCKSLFSFEHAFAEIRSLAGPEVALLGNIPPRDVLAAGTPDMVREHVAAMKTAAADDTRVIFSCGGGLPPGVSTANLRAFLDEVLSGS